MLKIFFFTSIPFFKVAFCLFHYAIMYHKSTKTPMNMHILSTLSTEFNRLKRDITNRYKII